MNRIVKMQYILEKYAKTFDKKYLNSLPSLKDKISYFENNYRMIGSGADRNTYLISSKFYDHAPDFSWIEVRLVRPLYSSKEFEQLTEMKFEDFEEILFNWKGQSYINAINTVIKNISYIYKHHDDQQIIRLQSYINNPILKEIDRIKNITNLDLLDLTWFPNLGKSAFGHLSLLDVGRII